MNASPEYKEVTDTTEVPKHAGVEGFILAVRGILKLPRVVNINIDSRGKITHTRYARQEEPRRQVEVDFESVSPSSIVRNGHVQELNVEEYYGNAAVVCAAMFAAAAKQLLFPVAWVVGANTYLPGWHKLTTGVDLLNDTAFGLPLLRDRFIPDEALLLACAYGPNAALIDAQTAYKVTMPSPTPAPRLIDEEVSVLPDGPKETS